MILDDTNSNPNEEAPEFTLAPEGTYQLIITKAEYGDNKAGTGKLVRAEYEIVHDEHKGKVWGYYNIINPNEQAARIGRNELRRIGDAVGVKIDTDNLTPLIDKVFTADLKHKTSTYNGETRTNLEIKKVHMDNQPAPTSIPGMSDVPF